MSSGLVQSAQAQVDAMMVAGRLFHQDLNDDLASGPWTIVGENVGFGPSPQPIHNAFVASSGHYANLVDHRYVVVGIAVKVDGTGRMWVAQVFAG